MKKLAEALPQEIDRVKELLRNYREVEGVPNASEKMEAAIKRGILAAASGNEDAMVSACEDLKAFQR